MKKSLRKVLRFRLVGILAGLLMGLLLSLVSGDYFAVTLLIGAIGLFVGLICGFVYRNNPKYD